MQLRVGELARRCGLTVRTLHHYDDIGLLRPSARSDAGYRLYDRDDVARLQQIQALRSLGVSLADVGAILDRPESSVATVIEQQLSLLDQQIARQVRVPVVRPDSVGGFERTAASRIDGLVDEPRPCAFR